MLEMIEKLKYTMEEVLDIKSNIISCSISEDGVNINYSLPLGDELKMQTSINKYYFEHLCKEFMKDHNICVWSGNGYLKNRGYSCSITHYMFGEPKTFMAENEFEAVLDDTYAVITHSVDFD